MLPTYSIDVHTNRFIVINKTNEKREIKEWGTKKIEGKLSEGIFRLLKPALLRYSNRSQLIARNQIYQTLISLSSLLKFIFYIRDNDVAPNLYVNRAGSSPLLNCLESYRESFSLSFYFY